MTFDTLALFAKLSGFRVLVLANRLGCDTDIAHKAHNSLADKLAQMIADLRTILRAERNVATASDTLERDDARLDIYHYQGVFNEKWMELSNSLLDEILIDSFTNEYYDSQTQSWHFRDDTFPVAVAVDPSRLCGLSDIIFKIEEETGIWFNLEQACYCEQEAEEAWLANNALSLNDSAAAPEIAAT